MKTEIISWKGRYMGQEELQRAGDLIKAGGLVAFPTETVYGLGGDALNPASSRKIYAAKGRPSDNPLIVHICRLEDLTVIASDIPESARKLAEKFWPGPLTMIFKKTEAVPDETTGGLDTVAVRMPVHPAALELIEAAGGFVAAPSANLSGKPSPTLAKYVVEDLSGRVDMIIDGGDVEIGLESTILDMTVKEPMILRPGAITKEMLEAVLQSVGEDASLMSPDSGQAPKAPGMKYRHYAPKGDLTIVDGDESRVVEYINETVSRLQKDGKKTGVIATEETFAKYRADVCKCTGKRDDEGAAAKELYRILREFDDEDVTVIFAESFEASGIGRAVMNRLLKAAGYKVLHL